eukprot:5626466-Amphidinium_carterae.1
MAIADATETQVTTRHTCNGTAQKYGFKLLNLQVQRKSKTRTKTKGRHKQHISPVSLHPAFLSPAMYDKIHKHF